VILPFFWTLTFRVIVGLAIVKQLWRDPPAGQFPRGCAAAYGLLKCEGYYRQPSAGAAGRSQPY